MSKSIHLQIVTPRKVVFEGDVENFTAPGVMGPFQVLFNHAPIVAALSPGLFKLRDFAGKEQQYALSGGFLELHQNKGTVLAEAAETLQEIDVERARRALARAEERLRSHDKEIDTDRATKALERAQARIKASAAR